MPIKALVFDCDGVILDSVPVKTKAFGRLAEPYGQSARDQFVDYHAKHGGVSRYQKFAWFFDNVLKREIRPEESQQWGKKFEEYALEEVRKCPMIPGAMDTLQAWHGKLPLFVCSGAPGAEVAMILKERNLAQFFEGIYGTPPEKELLLVQIIVNGNFNPAEVVMVGDATTDQKAAAHAGSRFYAIGPELKGHVTPWSENFLPFNAWVTAHLE